jgi:hypothetical protein
MKTEGNVKSMKKISIVEYYILLPYRAIASKVKKLFKKVADYIRSKLFHYWYCGECDKYHSGRVIMYDWSEFLCDCTCSMGKAALIEDSKNEPEEDRIKEHQFKAYIRGEEYTERDIKQ